MPKPFNLSAQQSISFSVPWACHRTQGLWLLCWDRCLCSARQLFPGMRGCLPQTQLLTVQQARGSAGGPGLGQSAPLPLWGRSTPAGHALLQPLPGFHGGGGCWFPTCPGGASLTSGVCQQSCREQGIPGREGFNSTDCMGHLPNCMQTQGAIGYTKKIPVPGHQELAGCAARSRAAFLH